MSWGDPVYPKSVTQISFWSYQLEFLHPTQHPKWFLSFSHQPSKYLSLWIFSDSPMGVSHLPLSSLETSLSYQPPYRLSLKWHADLSSVVSLLWKMVSVLSEWAILASLRSINAPWHCKQFWLCLRGWVHPFSQLKHALALNSSCRPQENPQFWARQSFQGLTTS